MKTIDCLSLVLVLNFSTPAFAKTEPSGVIGAFGEGAAVSRSEALHFDLDQRTISDLELMPFIKKLQAYAPSKMSRERLTWWLTHPSLDAEEIVRRQRAIIEIAVDDELFEQLEALFSAPERNAFRRIMARVGNAPDLMGRENLAKAIRSRTLGLEYIEIFFVGSHLWTMHNLIERLMTFSSQPGMASLNLFMAMLGTLGAPLMVRGHMPFVAGIGRADQSRRLNSEIFEDREFFSERLAELAELCRNQQSCANAVTRLGRLQPASGRGYLGARMTGISPLLAFPAALYTRRSSEAVLKMIDTVVELETYYAAARLMREHSEVLQWPRILTENPPRLNFDEGLHPYLWLAKKQVVPNSIRLNAVDQKGYVLTGPNTGGKTTFQQTKCLLAIMAMAGLPVPAKNMEVTPAIVMTEFKNDDYNQNDEHSLFKAQTMRTSEVVNRVLDETRTAPMIVAFDEILTGTSDTDHDALERGTLKTILDTPDALVTIATHERTLAEMTQEYPNLGTLKVALAGHVIENGVSNDYNASEVMERAGAPARLMELGRHYLELETSGRCQKDLEE